MFACLLVIEQEHSETYYWIMTRLLGMIGLSKLESVEMSSIKGLKILMSFV